MRILENVDLPSAFADLFVKLKPKESPVVVPSEELEISEDAVEPIDEEDGSEKKVTQETKMELPEPVPEPPKRVHMANLCVVGGHAVNGVAEIHSEIVKDEVFNAFFKVHISIAFSPSFFDHNAIQLNDSRKKVWLFLANVYNIVKHAHVIDLSTLQFWQLWPEKFQNKTNGVTPRRWIHFCNPELSKIITDWIGSEDWVLNTEKLAELRKVIHHNQISCL